MGGSSAWRDVATGREGYRRSSRGVRRALPGLRVGHGGFVTPCRATRFVRVDETKPARACTTIAGARRGGTRWPHRRRSHGWRHGHYQTVVHTNAVVTLRPRSFHEGDSATSVPRGARSTGGGRTGDTGGSLPTVPKEGDTGLGGRSP